MERAEARRLQPHYIAVVLPRGVPAASAARVQQREPRRYEITHVPAPIRNRDRLIGIGEPVLPRYERITFEKDADQRRRASRWPRSSAPATRCSTRRSTSSSSATATCSSAAPCWSTSATPATTPRVLVLPRARDPGRRSLDPAAASGGVVSQADALRRDRRRADRRRHCPATRPTSTTGRSPTDEPALDALLDGPSAPGSTASSSRRRRATPSPSVVPEHLAEVRDRQARARSPRPRRR